MKGFFKKLWHAMIGPKKRGKSVTIIQGGMRTVVQHHNRIRHIKRIIFLRDSRLLLLVAAILIGSNAGATLLRPGAPVDITQIGGVYVSTFAAGVPVVVVGSSSTPIVIVSRSGRPKIISTTLTSGTTGYTGSVSGISLFAQSADATFTISMGSSSLSGTTSPTITLRNGIGMEINPDYIVTSATVTWISGTIDVVIDGTTP